MEILYQRKKTINNIEEDDFEPLNINEEIKNYKPVEDYEDPVEQERKRKLQRERDVIEAQYKNPEFYTDPQGKQHKIKYNKNASRNRLQAKVKQMFSQSVPAVIEDLDTSLIRQGYHTAYRDTLKGKVFSKDREDKIKNKKSRLYQKDQVAKAFAEHDRNQLVHRENAARLRLESSDEMRHAMSPQQMRDYSELARLLSKPGASYEEQMAKYTEIIATTCNVENAPGTNWEPLTEEEAIHGRTELLTEMTNRLLKIRYGSNLQLMNDNTLLEHAQKFEDDAKFIEIYERLLEQTPAFLESVDNADRTDDPDVVKGHTYKARIMKRIEQVKAVSSFYKVRKMILTNPYYRTHYNEEISMNAKSMDPPEQKVLSKLLRTSYYLAKNLASLGVSKAEGQNIISPRLDAGTDEYTANIESEVCSISMDENDHENDLEVKESLKKRDRVPRMVHGERERQMVPNPEYQRLDAEYQALLNQKKAESRDYQKNADELIRQLERESSYLVNEADGEEKLDLKKLQKKKLTTDDILIGLSPVSDSPRKYLEKKYRIINEKRYDKINNILRSDDRGTKKFGMISKNLGKQQENNEIQFGDSFNRMLSSFSSSQYDDMTDSEFLELFENLSRMTGKRMKEKYSTQKSVKRNGKTETITEWKLTDSQQAREEEYFLDSSYRYLLQSYKILRKFANSIGDTLTFLHPKDCLKMFSPKKRYTLITLLGYMQNVKQDGILNLLAKTGSFDMSPLKNMDKLIDYLTHIGFMVSPVCNSKIKLFHHQNIPENIQAQNKRTRKTKTQTAYEECNRRYQAARADLEQLEAQVGQYRQTIDSKTASTQEKNDARRRLQTAEPKLKDKRVKFTALKEEWETKKAANEAEDLIDAMDETPRKFLLNAPADQTNLNVEDTIDEHMTADQENLGYFSLHVNDIATGYQHTEQAIKDIKYSVLGIDESTSIEQKENKIFYFRRQLRDSDPQVIEEVNKLEKKMDEELNEVIPLTPEAEKQSYLSKTRNANGGYHQDIIDQQKKIIDLEERKKEWREADSNHTVPHDHAEARIKNLKIEQESAKKREQQMCRDVFV